MAFAHTANLTLRSYRDSDLELLYALWNDPRVQRTGTNEPVRPRTVKWAREALATQIETSALHVIIEITNPVSVKKAEVHDGGDSGTATPGAMSETEEGDKYAEDKKFVGYCLLEMGHPKNRDANLAIALLPQWWGNGFGTEVVRWIVDYGFENLGLHRMSLAVMDGNERALCLYRKMCVSISDSCILYD